LTAASCPKKDFYPPPPPPPKNMQQTFVLHTENSTTFVLRIQKSVTKSRPKKFGKGRKKRWKKGNKKSGKKLAKNTPKKHTAIYTTHMLSSEKNKKLLKAYS